MMHRLNRWLFIAVVTGCLGMLTPVVRGDNLMLQLFPFTGEVRFTNPNATPFDFVFYSLSSTGGALDPSPAVWKSITSTYDRPGGATPGNGYIDPLHDWLVLKATSNFLEEGVILNPGGQLAPFRSVSLGQIWNPDAPVPAVLADVRHPNTTAANIIHDFSIAGDYNFDDEVSMSDFFIWKQYYGQSGSVFSQLADGNLNGVVDGADYVVWRNNLGLSLADLGFASGGAELGLGQGGVVPEPGAGVLLLIAAGWMAFARRRR
jgi:hypothetical protein